MSLKKVAIIGAGRAGLVSAKYALENGLEPVILEKTNQIGGLWSRNNETAIWNGMFSNVSKYTMMFHDHPWPNDTPIYLTAEQVHEYFKSYAQKFKLNEHIRFETKVEFVKKLDTNKWELKLLDIKTNTQSIEVFDFLIIASGLHSKPRIPQIENSSQFKGLQMHSCEYRLNDPRLKDKKVIVLGCSISGTEISASLVGHAKTVTNIFPRPYLVSPRLVCQKVSDSNYKIVPIEMFYNQRVFHYPSSDLTPQEIKNSKIEFFTKIFPYQTNKEQSNSNLYVDLTDPNQEILVAVSDYYIPYVKEGKIKPIKSNIKEFKDDSVVLENGLVEDCDVIIYCAGYDIACDYFERSILETIKYDTKNYRFSIILYKCTFHPDLKNFAMVGQVEGSYYTGSELQANWACRVFTGKNELPRRDLMLFEINEDEKKRFDDKKSRYPYGQHTILIDKIAKASNQLPDFNEIKRSNPNLYEKLWNSGINTCHYFLNDNGSIDLICEAFEVNKRNYHLTKEINDLNLEDFASEFSKFHKLPQGLFKIN